MFTIGLGHTKHRRDHIHRIRAGQIVDHLRTPLLDNAVEIFREDRPNLVLHLRDGPSGEHTTYEFAEHGVIRRVELDHLVEAHRLTDRSSILQSDTTGRRIQVCVAERLLHILEAREGPEPQFVVPITRRFIAHALIRDVGVIVMREAERVEDEIIHVRDRSQ